MKRVAQIVGTILVIAFFGVFAYMRWLVTFGQEKLGGACQTRAGCRSYYCLNHERAGGPDGTERVVAGYCTAACKDDHDCAESPGMSCVTPSQAALDDLARWGRPAKLCMRVR